jgi:glycosyltransferase involved in cell wall biosynthesis
MSPYRSDIRILPNPISLAAYVFRPKQLLKKRLVWIRSFLPVYNPFLAVKTMAILRARHPDVTLEMYGPDFQSGTREAVREMSVQLGLRDCVRLFDAVPKSEIPRILERGDIFLNTANRDNAPVTVIEALASGLCVVSTNVGGVPFLVQHNQDALLVPPDDPEAMAAAVETLWFDPDLVQRLRDGGRRKAMAHDISLVGKMWQSIFMEMYNSG